MSTSDSYVAVTCIVTMKRAHCFRCWRPLIGIVSVGAWVLWYRRLTGQLYTTVLRNLPWEPFTGLRTDAAG